MTQLETNKLEAALTLALGVLLLAERLLGLLEPDPVPDPVVDDDGRLDGVLEEGVGGIVDGASVETAD